MSGKRKRLHAYISGRVQGVFFRATTKESARQLGLTGWVKNLSNGQVEVMAEGKKEDLKALERFLQDGPRLAEVQNVNVNYSDDLKGYSSFRIRH